MNQDARVQSVIELLDNFFRMPVPFDIVLSKYFKNNRWIGSGDRRAISEAAYDIFRNFELLKFLTKKITADFGRFFVLARLSYCKQLSDSQLDSIFSGKKYAPSQLTPFERKFVNKCRDQAEKINNAEETLPQNILLNYPEWMTPYFQKAFEDSSFEEELKALNTVAPVDLRVNTLKATKEEVLKLLQKDFKTEDMQYAPDGIRIVGGRIGRGHEVIREGLAEIQDEGSQMIAEICGAQPGDTIIDYCAGAGGKTLALASKLKNKGRIFALDKYPERLERAKLRLRKAGASNVTCLPIDHRWLKRHGASADVVLVDAPCSGTGTWRRNPDMRAKFQPKDLQELVQVQYEILKSAQELVKEGGVLVYSTCSLLKEENQDQINKFLSDFPQFLRKQISIESYKGDFLHLSPSENHTDGFFAAVLQKTQ